MSAQRELTPYRCPMPARCRTQARRNGPARRTEQLRHFFQARRQHRRPRSIRRNRTNDVAWGATSPYSANNANGIRTSTNPSSSQPIGGVSSLVSRPAALRYQHRVAFFVLKRKRIGTIIQRRSSLRLYFLTAETLLRRADRPPIRSLERAPGCADDGWFAPTSNLSSGFQKPPAFHTG